ncbi:MAG TPA: phosphotransferase [Polyangiaceae bacterium]|nr:phosphotransferase [Polyangiaceae bacterium]
MESVVRGYRVQPLAAILAGEFRERAYKADLATLVGDRGFEEIERWVDELTQAEFGVPPSGALFAKKSAGAVFGIVLESGEPAVLKLFNRSLSHSELSAMQRCLAVAAAHGFPVARQRSEIFEADAGLFAAFYGYLDGAHGNPHEPPVRRELSRSLAELNALLAPLDTSGLPLAPGRQAELWPAAQHVWETREIDDEDARFIAAHAREAQLTLKKAKLPLLATHSDWGVNNIRFRDDAVCAVFDSDSIHAASEAECVGRAAAQFTAQWEVPAVLTPSPDEAQAFVDEYQTARGRKFSRAERALAAAAARYAVARAARLEHLSGVPEADNYRGLLRDYEANPLL